MSVLREREIRNMHLAYQMGQTSNFFGGNQAYVGPIFRFWTEKNALQRP